MPIDLHCHTRISDGSLGVEELIAIAKRRGLTAIAVTDHDAVIGATRAGMIGKRQGVEVIPGVELTATDPACGRKVHILGYLYDHPDRLEGYCRQVMQIRRTAAAEMIRRVLRYYPIVPDMITRCAAGSTGIYRAHIMHALMEAGYAASIHGRVYDRLFSANGGCAVVPCTYPDVREAIRLLHSAGGIAVLAHPYTYDSEELMEALTAEGLLDGIEVWRPDHTPEQIERLIAFADAHGLLKTGGSDFHGMYSATVRPLGCAGIPDDTVQAMLNCKAARLCVTE